MIVALISIFLFAASASARTFEQAGIFAGPLTPPPSPSEYPEEIQLGGVSGMAVNVSGAGGVPAGTLYAAAFADPGELKVLRYDPEPGGEAMEFAEAWRVRAVEGEYERCGPKGKPSEPHCAVRPSEGARGVDVDVDQETGYVYVLNGVVTNAGKPMVTVYKPDGSEVITRFGEAAVEGEKTAASPGKIHASQTPGGLAVDDTGKVYVYDLNNFDNFYHRLMVFEPQGGTYVYAGQGKDVAAGFLGQGNLPTAPVTDAAGDVYVAGETFIEKYDPAQPGTPLCSFSPVGGGIRGMTVDRASGEVYYYTTTDKQVHQLGPCEEGKFQAVPSTPFGLGMEVAPTRGPLTGFAFDQLRKLGEREAGVLYGAAPSGPALGYIFAPVEENPPAILSESVSAVGTVSAEIQARINPRGSVTSYVFEYLTAAAYEGGGESFAGAVEAPVGGAVLGVGQVPLDAAAMLSGLEPDTEYRYRVVARSHCSGSEPEKVCEAVGSPQSFHTFPAQAAGLPDARAYELVSPAIKNGGQVFPADPGTSSCGLLECKPGGAYQYFPIQSAPNGEAIVYEGNAFAAGQGATIENEYRAQRTPTGWVNSNLTPELMQSKSGIGGYRAFDPFLSRGLLAQASPALASGAPQGYVDFYGQPTASPLALEPLLTEANAIFHRLPGEFPEPLRLVYAGASDDLSRIFFEANDALTEDATDPADPEKENNLYEWANGELSLVNVFPDESTEPGAVFGSGTLLKSGNPNVPVAVVTSAISDDGSRAFWSSKSGQVYMRIDGVETREVDDPGKFLAASETGSKILLDDGCLYDLAEESCDDLTADEAEVHQGGFLGVLGQSEDLSHVYFVDSAVLTGSEENGQGEEAQAGKPNLYSFAEGTTMFVATLLTGDNAGNVGDWQAAPAVRTAEASPSGRYLTFISRAPLTGFNNVGPCEFIGGVETLGPCREAFLYDSETGNLICASCGKSGASPLGPTVLRVILGARGYLPQPRYLTDSGRLYFDSRDSLVPADTNAGIEDVYQYEPEGIGNCSRDGGCVALISAGRGGSDSNLLTIDQSGDNVFFTTRDRLVPSDHDDLIDLYDARVGGGFAADAQAPEPPCDGGCQPTPPTSTPPPPPSSTFVGPNSPRCKKGQVRRNGRCVKKQKAKKQKHGQKKKSGSRGR